MRKAFTLIELLTVIAIIGILSAILLPSLILSKEQGKSAVCRSNLRQIQIALMSYTQDTGYYPYWGLPANSLHPQGIKWYDALMSVNWSNGVYRCPSYRGVIFDGRGLDGGVLASFGGYGYNFGSCHNWVYKLGIAGDYHFGLGAIYQPTKESSVLNPADCIMLGDSFSRGGTNIYEGVEILSRSLHNYASRPMSLRIVDGTHRHRGYSQIVFGDNHVERQNQKKLFSDEFRSKWHKDNLPHMEIK